MGEGNAKDWPKDRACCTIVVYPGESIQDAINALPPEGGCVCLKSGVHKLDTPVIIPISNVILHGEAPGVRVVATKPIDFMVAVNAGNGSYLENIEITHITFDYAQYYDPPFGPNILAFVRCRRVRVIHCELLYTNPAEVVLVQAIVLADVTDAGITDNLMDRMFNGVYAHDIASAVLVADNTIRGQLRKTEFGMTTFSWLGVLLGIKADGCVRDNVIESFQTAVEVIGNHADVIGNRIRPYPLPAGLDTNPSGDISIVAETKQPGLVRDNDIELPSLSCCGIYARNEGWRITGNHVRSTYAQASLDGPTAISVTGERHLISGNQLAGIQVGILAKQGTGLEISNNIVSGGGDAPLGIKLEECHDCLVSGNELNGLLLPFMLTDGYHNRLVGNATSATRIGAWFSRESGIEVTDSSFDDSSALGVAGTDLKGTAHFSNVSVRNCGYAATTTAFGLVISQPEPKSVLDATIENCDVLDTGVATDGSVTPGKAWGIATRYVSHLKISENRVRYPAETPLPATAEHRALMLVGVPADVSPPGKPRTERSFGAALISGNVLQGPSQDRLVDVRRVVLSPTSDLRFERVTFSVNRCDHFGRPGPQNITADLYGSRMIVTSNQVKTPAKGHSFGFGNRPKVATTSNNSSGNYVNVASTVPAVLANFNVIG